MIPYDVGGQPQYETIGHQSLLAWCFEAASWRPTSLDTGPLRLGERLPDLVLQHFFQIFNHYLAFRDFFQLEAPTASLN
jgi:hypothetical protein